MASPNVAQRREEQRTQVRRAILDATETLLLEAGYARFSIRRLVERCGYTAPTIYHHFGDKPGLLDALLEERFQALFEEVEKVPQGDEPEDQLRAQALAVIDFADRYPAHYRLLALPREPGWAPPPGVEESRQAMRAPFDQLEEACRLRTRGVEPAAQAMWALVHGLISLRTDHGLEDWSAHTNEDAIDAMLRGLVHAADEPGDPR